MKKCILMTVVCLSTILLFTIFLQAEEQSEDLSQPIETGFVFWEGKYIEAPYHIERRELSVYINGIPIREKTYHEQKEIYVDEDPGDLDYVSKYAGIRALDTLRSDDGRPIWFLKVRYLQQHYLEDIASQKINDYFRSLPFIEKVEKYIGDEIIKVTDYFDESLLVPIKKTSHEEYPSLEEMTLSVQHGMERIIQSLKRNNCHFFFKGGEIKFSGIKTAIVLPETISALMDDSISRDDKRIILKKLSFALSDQLGDMIIDNLEYNPQLEMRLDELRQEIIKEKGEDYFENIQKDLLNESSGEKGKDGSKQDCCSPNGREVVFYYANAFERDWEDEIASITDNIEAQWPYFNASASVIYYDNTSNDDETVTCTLSNFRNCYEADILSIHSHGVIGHFMVAYFKTYDGAYAWWNQEPNMYIGSSSKVFWDGEPAFYVTANLQWAEQNWSSSLSQSNAIVFVNSCHGNEKIDGSSFLTSCLGRVGFGYPDDTNLSDRVWNNNELLKKMNSTVGNGAYRSAGEAYINIINPNDDWEMEGNGNTTLCPATSDYSPTDGEIVDATGTGYFEVDTYCTDDISANEALTFETTGDVSVSNVQWEGTDQVNRIDYDWSADSDFLVDVTVHHEEFQSWGAPADECHYLDFDPGEPGMEDGEYHFSHEHNGEIATSTPISIPHDNEYSILFEDDVDYYQMNLNSNTTYKMYTELINDSDLDPAFYLLDSEEKVVAEDDDSGADYGNAWQPYIEYKVDIDQGGVYYLRVAYCNNELKDTKDFTTGDYKLIIQETINSPELISPAHLDIADGYSIQFTWEESFGATQYMIEIAYDPGFSTFFQIPYPFTDDTNITVSNFDNDGTPYYWHVTAGNGNIWSNYSSPCMFYNGVIQPPEAPDPLTPRDDSEQSGEEITFTWEASSGAVDYELEIAYDENFDPLFPNGSSFITEDTYISVDGFPDGDPATDFCWHVKASNAGGPSEYSETFHFLNVDKKITLYVPSAYPTIQEAIDAAQDGDTVLVDPGTYYENLIFRGRNITVISAEGYSVTIINGGDNGSVVTFENGEDESCVLSGFTIKNGTHEYGAGIFCVDSSPTLENLKIRGNVADSDDNGNWGGGIAFYNSSSCLRDSKICYNTAEGAYAMGGGILCGCSSNITLTNVDIYNNNVTYASAKGGGMFIGNSNVTLRNVSIYGNSTYITDSYGGGIYVEGSYYGLNIENVTIFNNYALYGSGIYCEETENINISNSIIRNNSSCSHDQQITLSGGAVVSISYSDIEDGENGIYIIDSGGYRLWNIIDEDPLFVDPNSNDLNLTIDSPCIDAGDPDLDGDGITWVNDPDDQDPDGTRMDMGALCFSKALIEGTVTLSGGGDNSRSVTGVVIRAGEYKTNPDENGDYSLDIRAGTYDVYAIVPGYGIGQETNVEVTPSDPTTVDFSLSYNGYIIINQDGIAHFSDLSGTACAKNNETVVIYDGYYEDDMIFFPDTTSVTITVRGLGQSYTDDTVINGDIIMYGVDDFELNISYLTFDGEDGIDTVIDPDCLTSGSGTITLCGNIIRNYARHGIGIPDGCTYYFDIRENIIEDCDVDVYAQINGAGISCESSALIKENIIRNNRIAYSGASTISYGGGIYISTVGDTSDHIIISNNEIYGNSAYYGGAIFCEGDGDIEITGNDIYENTVSSYGTDSGECVGIYSKDYEGELILSYNCLYNNIENYCSYVIFLDDNQHTFVYNNTIAYNDDLAGMYLDGGTVTLLNNIITGNEVGISQYGCNDTIQYCNVYNNGTNYSNCSAGTGCISTDPLFADSANGDYSPAWNDTLFSPCIDTGDPDSLYNDADGTPSDMGAFAATTHEYFRDDYDEYSFDNVDWISFPVLNRTTTNWMRADSILIKQGLMDDDQIYNDDILYQVVFENDEAVSFDDGWQIDLTDDEFDSKQGYKIEFKEQYDSVAVQGISGTWLDLGTSIQLYAGQENWVGCFLEEPLYFEDAFESIEDEWITISSEHWAQSRQSRIPPSRTANPGELYIITVENDCQLIWNSSGSGGGITPFIKERTDHFKYIETIDYMAVDIDTVYSDISIVEIAVFSDDECLGATKVYGDEYPVQILAYTSEGTKGGGNELEFRIYYEGQKSADTTSVPYVTYNTKTQAFSSQPLSYERNGFARVQLNTDESSVIHKLTLLQNYPNPVRTTMTTIRFMPEQDAGHTELNIYNIRGQLVRTIDCDGTISSGTKDSYYSISWDCRDRYGKDVKNGIYFYKLTSGDKSAVHKMLLVK